MIVVSFSKCRPCWVYLLNRYWTEGWFSFIWLHIPLLSWLQGWATLCIVFSNVLTRTTTKNTFTFALACGMVLQLEQWCTLHLSIWEEGKWFCFVERVARMFCIQYCRRGARELRYKEQLWNQLPKQWEHSRTPNAVNRCLISSQRSVWAFIVCNRRELYVL